MAQIRVLHMIGSLNMGGSQTMIMNLYRNIDRNKIQFDFILDHPDQLYFADEVKHLGGKIYFMPTFTGKNIVAVIKAWNSFFKKHKEYGILHSHVRSYASLYLPIAKKYGLKTIIHSHNTSSGSGFVSIVKKALQYPLRYQADYYFACSLLAGKWLFGEKVVKKSNFIVLNNAIDSDSFSFSESKRNAIRKELNIDTSCLVIGHVGRFHSQKNHVFLIDIFTEIQKKVQNSALVLVGNGELQGEIKNKVKKLGLTKKVIFAGVRNDIPDILSAIDAFVFPSVFEGLPVVVIEAQASGVKCFLSNTITQEVDITDNCLFLPIDNPMQWAEAITKANLIRKKTLDKISDAGYDIKRSSRNLEEFYFKIVKE